MESKSSQVKHGFLGEDDSLSKEPCQTPTSNLAMLKATSGGLTSDGNCPSQAVDTHKTTQQLSNIPEQI